MARRALPLLVGGALAVAGIAVSVAYGVGVIPTRGYQVTTGEATAAEPPTAVGVLQQVQAADGSTAHVVYAAPGKKRVIVYLHGMCGPVVKDVQAFSNAAIQFGHVVAPVGPVACPNGQTQWGGDLDKMEAQISAALDAAGAGRTWDRSDMILVGYSQGAHRGEQLAAQFPHYRRTVLIGSPVAPNPQSFASTTAASFLAGERDRQDLMKRGYKSLQETGKPTQFLELPGAAHGEFGPEGERVMTEAITFVIDPSRG